MGLNPKYLAQNNLEWLFYSAAVGLITCYALAVYLSLFQISAHLYHSGQAYYLCFPATQKHQSDPVQIPTNMLLLTRLNMSSNATTKREYIAMILIR